MRNLNTLIGEACSTTAPNTTQRNAALKRIKWRLKSGLLYAGLDAAKDYACALVAIDDALVFDGRDNEVSKLAYWQAVTGFRFEVELCAS